MRFEVLTAAKMSLVVFWVVTPCGLLVGTDVSEEPTASIFTLKEDEVCAACSMHGTHEN
jgi:hypothetical protein